MTVTLTRTDPRVKKACAVCGKPRNLVPQQGTQLPRLGYYLKRDSFCSADCCRQFHSVEFASETIGVLDRR